MTDRFQANCLPVLIGSLPVDDHAEAVKIVFKYTPEIPLWVQLPVYREEGMMAQFLPGLPGFTIDKDKIFIDTDKDDFDDELLKFYEEYMAVSEGKTELFNSRFALKEDTAKGFFVFMDQVKKLSNTPVAVKGQITGPITIGTGVTDQNKRAVFYDNQIMDAAVKLLALKARWQVKQLSKFGCPVILFFDEPALAGFGSSTLISISREEIAGCFDEVIEAVHEEGGLAGIHVCANTDWALVFDSLADIVSFDAYSFFDRFMLYPDHIRRFFKAGRILAWGIVPTLKAEDIEKETSGSLVAMWEEKAEKIEKLGIDKSIILAQSLITPSCGTGSLSFDHAVKVLEMTKNVSKHIRNNLK